MTVQVCPFFMLGEVVPTVTFDPAGTDVKSTLWVAVSWLVHVIVLLIPTMTSTLTGEKLSDWLLPTPAGITICVFLGAELVVVVVVVVLVVVV